MKDRLIKFMHINGYTSSKFADEIGVQRSGISHILSGRNQPSYDFIVKTMDKFPELNIEWLLLGKGTMMKNKTISSINNENTQNDKKKTQPDLFSEIKNKNIEDNGAEKVSGKVTYVNNIEKVILLMCNGTFKVYNMNINDS